MNFTKSRWASLILVPMVIVLITGFNYYSSTTAKDSSSNDDWCISTPEVEGMNPELLGTVMSVITDERLPVDSVIVVRNGFIVMEEYSSQSMGSGTTRKLYSATKSITSALVGIAIQEGYIQNVDQKILDYFPDKVITDRARRQEITIRHLLTMTAGYEWGSDGTGTGMRTSSDPVQYVLDKSMVQEPGAVYNYGDGAPFLLGAIIHEATGMSVLEFAKEYLFDPLNITDFSWDNNRDQYFAASGLWMLPRDMAKIGQLFLNEGKWGNEQIISQEWVRESTQTYISGSGYMAGQDFYVDGYGYLWWTYPEIGVYYASGMYEQRIYVCPDLELVAVFTSHNDGADVTPRLLFKYILPACSDYTLSSYSKYNVSFSYPRGMKIIEAPSPFDGASISKESGFVQAYFSYPIESISVMWFTLGEEMEISGEMTKLFSMIEDDTTVIERGMANSLEVNGHNVLCLNANVTQSGVKTTGVIAGWLNEDTNRVILTYYITDPGFFSQQEIKNTFFDYIKSIRE